MITGIGARSYSSAAGSNIGLDPTGRDERVAVPVSPRPDVQPRVLRGSIRVVRPGAESAGHDVRPFEFGRDR